MLLLPIPTAALPLRLANPRPPLSTLSIFHPRFDRIRFLCSVSFCSENDNFDHFSTSAADCEECIGGVVFAAGGTCGHVYPAIAIADEIRASSPSTKILFLGSDRGLEKNVVPSVGYEFESIPAFPLPRPPFSPANFLFPIILARSVVRSWRILREFNPRVVIGTGGYVAAPVCFAAAIAGIDVVIQEQNGYPGIANRALASFAKMIFLAFHSSTKYFPKDKCVVSGNPVRASLRKLAPKEVAIEYFFHKTGNSNSWKVTKEEVVLVLGGSCGAHAINVAMLNMYCPMLMKHKNRFIIWQTGEGKFCEMESLANRHPRLFLTPFLHSMDMAYAAADVVVSRAGAMTCTEILTTGKPSILIPSSNVSEDHQTKNARIMAETVGSKILMEDELDPCTLELLIDDVLCNEQIMSEMSEKAMSVALPDASKQIVEQIINLIKLSNRKKKANAI